MKKVALHNLGCKVNAYETDAMQQMLEEHGYEIVPFAEGADVYIINTCAVTNMADRKSRQMIHKAKKMNPDAIVVAAGCYVQTSHEQAKQDTCIDLIVGNNNKKNIVALLQECEEKKQTGTRTEGYLDINEKGVAYETLAISRTGEHTRAYVKVQDGCNQFCSYCIIPYARGRVRSRKKEDVLAECNQLAANGYKEVVLTGIHVSSYGVDFQNGDTLLELIQAIHQVEGIERIRLGSLEPRVVTEAFAKAISKLPKVCPHFHLSLQSGCNDTLKRMNRHYTAEEYAYSCYLLRKYYAHPAITTDIIVGFPGETEEEFQKTVEFVKHVNFYETHIFKYSRRKGTRADKMDNQVPEDIKTQRSNVLLSLNKENSRDFREYYMGKEEEVLLEEAVIMDGQQYLTGHTREYIRVAVKAQESKINSFVTGRLMDYLQDEILFME